MPEARFQTNVGAQNGGTLIEVPLDAPAVFRPVRAPVRIAVLAAVSRARAAFDGASLSHRREWVEEAKRLETRERRIGRVVEQVLTRA